VRRVAKAARQIVEPTEQQRRLSLQAPTRIKRPKAVRQIQGT